MTEIKWEHVIPIGTHVSFKNDSNIYIVDCYSDLLCCDDSCSTDHDHYTTQHITVRKEHWTSFPLRDLRHVFDLPHHSGRDATLLERTPRAKR